MLCCNLQIYSGLCLLFAIFFRLSRKTQWSPEKAMVIWGCWEGQNSMTDRKNVYFASAQNGLLLQTI